MKCLKKEKLENEKKKKSLQICCVITHYLFILTKFGEQIYQRVKITDIFGLQLLVFPQKVFRGF